MPFPRGRHPQAILRRAAFLISYVMHRKWCMLLESRRYQVPLRVALAHDLDKFSPSYLWLWIMRDEIERCDRDHKGRTLHSWEYWADAGDPSGYRPMSDLARRELLADWRAAQRMRGGRNYAQRVAAAYHARRDAIGFHPITRTWVEAQLAAF
jgi:hypothetical protein